MDEDRRDMIIRIQIHSVFMDNINEDSVAIRYVNATNKLSDKKKNQYEIILKLLADREWHITVEIADELGLKDTRTKELIKELVGCEILVDDGNTKGKIYKLK